MDVTPRENIYGSSIVFLSDWSCQLFPDWGGMVVPVTICRISRDLLTGVPFRMGGLLNRSTCVSSFCILSWVSSHSLLPYVFFSSEIIGLYLFKSSMNLFSAIVYPSIASHSSSCAACRLTSSIAFVLAITATSLRWVVSSMRRRARPWERKRWMRLVTSNERFISESAYLIAREYLR